MGNFLVRSWRPLALRGLVSVLFGMVALVWPSLTLAALVLLFGAFALIDGLLAIAAAAFLRVRQHGWKLLLEGLIGAAIGLAAFFWTGMTTLVLIDLIAFWAMVTGILEIVLAVRIREDVPGELLLAIGGVASVLLGMAMLAFPTASALVIVTMLGCYAIVFGAVMLGLAFRLRRFTARWDPFEDHFPSGSGTA